MKDILEKKILCTALMNLSKFDILSTIFDGTEVEMFRYKNLYNEIKESYLKAEILEIETMKTETDILFEILECKSLVVNLEKNIKDFKEEYSKSTLKAYIKQADNMLEQEDSQTVKNFIGAKLGSIEHTDKKTIHNVRDITSELLEEAEKESEVLNTGFKNMGEKIVYERGDLAIIAGRPAMGKTAYMLQKLINLLDQGKNVVLISCEMSRKQLIKRMISNLGKLSLGRIKNLKNLKYFTKEENEKWALAIAKLNNYTNLRIIDTQGKNDIATLQSDIIKSEKELGGLDFIMLDYIQLVRTNKKSSRYEEVTEVSMWAKNSARQFNCVFIALAQLSRSVEQRADRRPMLSDLKESGQLEQDASVIQFLYRDEYYNEDTEFKGVLEVDTAKSRDGETFREYFGFIGETQTITEGNV